MNLNNRIVTAIRGARYLESASHGDYWPAQAVKSALRRKDPFQRLSGVREALNQYRVTAWLTDAGKIELRRDGKPVELL